MGFVPKMVIAQSGGDFCINKFMVINDSSFVDDYGLHSPWIEIFNKNHAPIDMGGMYLTNDLKNPKMFQLPNGDSKTMIPANGYLLLWAENKPEKGVLHLNFDLKKSNFIGLFSANGKTLIDSVTIRANQKANISFGRITDGNVKWDYLYRTTVRTNKNNFGSSMKGLHTVKVDAFGISLALVSLLIVFIVLTSMFLIFKYLSRLYNKDVRKKFNKKKGIPDSDEESEDGISGEVSAVLAMTLYLYRNELHDIENTVLTIKKVSRTYSPWSSKIYGLQKMPK
jgi:hypothetical protein